MEYSQRFVLITVGQRPGFVRLGAAKLDKPMDAMALPGHVAVGARLSAGINSRRNQALILTGFVGFQALDSFTTHLGLALQHEELNRIMGPLIATRGELLTYAVKGTAIAVLLAILMLMHRRKPRVWHAYHVAAWLSAVAVIANVLQLL